MSEKFIDTITGTVSAGHFLGQADSNIIKIIGSIEDMNDPSIVLQLKGMDFLTPFTREFEGLQGATEAVSSYRVWAVEDGSYQDADTYNETHEMWRYKRRAWVIKDKDFSSKMLRQIREEGKEGQLTKVVNERVAAISDLYINGYLPNIAYSTLLELPNAVAKTGYYAEPMGFLMDTPVQDTMLKPAKRRAENLIRNHYRSIAGQHVELEDIQATVSYMTEYRDTNGSNIVGLANDFTKFKLINTLAYDANKDVFARTGQPVDVIAGVKFISNDYIPDDMILFINGDAKELITKLISPNPTMRGMAIVKDNGFEKLETVYDIRNSYFKIMPEGYHLTGRHYGIFLDISGDGTILDPAKAIGYGGSPQNRLPVMTADQLAKITDQKELLDESWRVAVGG